MYHFRIHWAQWPIKVFPLSSQLTAAQSSVLTVVERLVSVINYLSCTTYCCGLSVGKQYKRGLVQQKYQLREKQDECTAASGLMFHVHKISLIMLLPGFATLVKALQSLCGVVKQVLNYEAKLTWQWPFQRSCYTVSMTAHPLAHMI